MIINLKNNTPRIDETLLQRVLKNRNIKDVKTYLNVPKECATHYETLINMHKVCEVLTERVLWAENPEKILLLVDCDVDGYTSSAVFYRYMKKIRPDIEIEVVHHTGKQHGLSLDVLETVLNSNATIVCIPDASSGDFKEHRLLYDAGKTILVLDHHECDDYSDHAIVVNNELSPAYKGAISGVGIVYKACKALDDYIGFDEGQGYADDFLDLVALGNVADGISMHNMDARYLVQQGILNIKNQLMLSICKKQAFSMNNTVNITNIGWYIAPMLNAVVRAGTQAEKEKLFEGFLSDDEEFCDEVTAMCLSVKRKQDNEVKKALVSIQGFIEEKGLDKGNNVVMVDVTGQLKNELVGLVANKLLDVYKRPVILLHQYKEDNLALTGSCRSPRGLGNFRLTCTKTNLFNFCAGHGSAFGVSIDKDKVNMARVLLNEALEGVGEVDTGSYDVDAILTIGELKEKDIISIGELTSLWGNGIDEPLFLIKGMKINSAKIEQIGARKTTMKFTTRSGIDFIKFFTSSAQYYDMCCTSEEEFDSDKDLIIDVVCKFKVNEWNGNVKGQVEIVNFESKIDEMAFF